MGIAGISLPQLTIVLLIALAIFGTNRLKSLGGDLGTALRSFRDALNAPDPPAAPADPAPCKAEPQNAGSRPSSQRK